MLAAIRTRWDDLLRLAERRLPALTRYRQPEALPIRLHPRRIYIVPSRFGLVFGAMLVVMLMGGLNFNNNGALLLTFVLTGATVLSLPRAVKQLNQVSLVAVRAAPVHVGSDLELSFHFEVDGGEAHRHLWLTRHRPPRDEASPATRWRAPTPVRFDLVGAGGQATITVPAQRRGLVPVGRYSLASEYPFGLFHAWSVLHPDARVLVYPQPEPAGVPLPLAAARDAAHERAAHGEDWHGLRDYRDGDPQRLIAWKASARQDRLLVKEFAEPAGTEVVLDWHALAGLDDEARIARLTRWVLDASAQNLAYRLVLPRAAHGPARGDDHRHACLRELALLP